MFEAAKHFGESGRPGVCSVSFKLLIWVVRLLKPLPAALRVAGFAQLSSGEGGVAPWISHQFIAGPHRKPNDDNKGFTLESPTHLTWMFLHCGKKVEYTERTDTGGACTVVTERPGIQPTTFLLCVITLILTTAPSSCSFICLSILVHFESRLHFSFCFIKNFSRTLFYKEPFFQARLAKGCLNQITKHWEAPQVPYSLWLEWWDNISEAGVAWLIVGWSSEFWLKQDNNRHFMSCCLNY